MRPILTLLVLCLACASPQAQLPDIAPGAVEAERAIQRRLVIQELDNAQRQLDDIGFRMLAAAAPLCEDRTVRSIGARTGSASGVTRLYVEAMSDRVALTDTLTVIGVAAGSPAEEAGLVPGDRILRAGGEPIPVGDDARDALAGVLDNSGTQPVPLDVVREGARVRIDVAPLDVCDYGLVVTAEGDINAYADGERVIVPWAMMRFANDEELVNIVGHEIAHNAMGHSDAMLTNIALGVLLGAAVDAIADEDETGSATADFAEMAAQAYSQEFESEADYVGAYIVARAGYAIESLPGVWRRFASINPDAISYASTHPTTAERFVRLTETIAEINAKISSGQPLLPEIGR